MICTVTTWKWSCPQVCKDATMCTSFWADQAYSLKGVLQHFLNVAIKCCQSVMQAFVVMSAKYCCTAHTKEVALQFQNTAEKCLLFFSKWCYEAGMDDIGSKRTAIGLFTDIDSGLAVQRCHVPIVALAAQLSLQKREYSQRKREENAQGHGVHSRSCLPFFHLHLCSFQHIHQDERRVNAFRQWNSL